MVGNALLVDSADENGLSIEVLSRGTREAVFLSLRLALVAAYRKRGVNLPMVLDDVLVNFDAEQPAGPQRCSRSLAHSGHQLLMFTCHQHMAEMLEQLGSDVRVLPYHRDVVHRAATVTTRVDKHLVIEELSDAAEVVEPVYEEPEPEPETAVGPLETIESLEQSIEEILEEPAPEVVEVEVVEVEETPPPRKKRRRKKKRPAESAPTPVPDPEEELALSATHRERVQWQSPGMWWQDELLD